MQVWRTLHEEDLYPYHDHKVQHLEPGDHAQRMDFCHYIKAHPELLSAYIYNVPHIIHIVKRHFIQ